MFDLEMKSNNAQATRILILVLMVIRWILHTGFFICQKKKNGTTRQPAKEFSQKKNTFDLVLTIFKEKL